MGDQRDQNLLPLALTNLTVYKGSKTNAFTRNVGIRLVEPLQNVSLTPALLIAIVSCRSYLLHTVSTLYLTDLKYLLFRTLVALRHLQI